MSEELFRKVTENMKNAINSLPEKKRNFILTYEPCSNRGYAWDENITYKEIKNILSIKTDCDGHSGSSFSCCLRGAIEQLQIPIVHADEVIEGNDEVIKTHYLTLESL